MEVHNPKPIHTWTEFLKEVATIVVGVLIALTGEEAVEALHWHRQVAIVEDSLDDELSDALFAAQERLTIAECQHRTLDRLDQFAHQSGDLVVRTPPLFRVRLWGSAAWDAAVGSGAIAHMSHDRRHAYALLFSFVRSFREWNSEERELWATIQAYHRAGPITPEARDRFDHAVSQLRSLTGMMVLAARQFVDAARPLNIELNPEDAATLREPIQCLVP